MNTAFQKANGSKIVSINNRGILADKPNPTRSSACFFAADGNLFSAAVDLSSANEYNVFTDQIKPKNVMPVGF